MLLIFLLREGCGTIPKTLLTAMLSILAHDALAERNKYFLIIVLIIARMFLCLVLNFLTHADQLF